MDNICFLDFVLHRRTRRLTRASKDVPIGSRALDILELLITHRDRVVSRNEIMEAVWPATVVGDNNLNVQVANLRQILGSETIVTVPGRGLHFTPQILPDEVSPELPERPSLVVLPFSNLQSDPKLDWLADAFVEDITTELSRFRDLFVVARNSAFVYRQMPRDLRIVARELGVRYVLEGSVRSSQGRVRITTQLIEALSGGHVWAENFDGPLDNNFDMQTQIARAVVTALVPQVASAEADRLRHRPPLNLTAHELAQKAWTLISDGNITYEPTPDEPALALAEQALSIDPSSSLAWRTIAWVRWWHAFYGSPKLIEDLIARGIAAANKAIIIDARDHHAWRLKGLLEFQNNNPEAALSALRRAHDMNPNCSTTLVWLGLYEAARGDREKGIPYAEAAVSHSPNDPMIGRTLCVLGIAQFAARDYAATAETGARAHIATLGSPSALVVSIIGCVGAGHIDKARLHYNELLHTSAKFAEARLAGNWLGVGPDCQTRAHTFFQVAAGLADESEAAALLAQANL